jgi:hypothetical protein
LEDAIADEKARAELAEETEKARAEQKEYDLWQQTLAETARAKAEEEALNKSIPKTGTWNGKDIDIYDGNGLKFTVDMSTAFNFGTF